VFLETVHTTKGWPLAPISTAVTAHFLVGAVVVTYLPEVHRVVSIANATIVGALLSAIGILGWSSATSLWHLFVVAISSGSGWAMTSGAAINAMIAPWFDRDRPKAPNYAFNGASLGGVVFAPLLVWLIARIGFQSAAMSVGVAMLIIVGTLAHVYLRHNPADFGIAADGDPTMATNVSGAHVAPFARGSGEDEGICIRSRIIRPSRCSGTHLLARLLSELGASGAAAGVSVTTISAVAGRMLLGWLLGEHYRRHAAAANFLIQSVGVGLLCLSETVSGLLVGCAFFGLGFGNTATLPALIAQMEFRPADVTTVVALVAINQAIYALSPAILGGLRQVSANYTLPFAIACVLRITAALITLVGRTGPNGLERPVGTALSTPIHRRRSRSWRRAEERTSELNRRTRRSQTEDGLRCLFAGAGAALLPIFLSPTTSRRAGLPIEESCWSDGENMSIPKPAPPHWRQGPCISG
jgi:MFS family permease